MDLRISMICSDNGVPLLSIERPAFWLDINIQDGLWEQFRTSVTHHTLAMRENRPWTFPRFAAIVTAMFDEQFGGFSRKAARLRKFDSETTAAILGVGPRRVGTRRQPLWGHAPAIFVLLAADQGPAFMRLLADHGAQ